MIQKRLAILLVCTLFLGLMGCATARDSGAVAGTAIGAGVGAAVSKHNPWLGAMIGGTLGFIAGSAIGNYIDVQEKSRQESIRDLKYKPSQGHVARIESAGATPVTVKPGETIGLKVDYYVISPDPRAQVRIKETRIIKYNNKPIMEPLKRVLVKNQGMASSTAKIPIPRDAQPGKYEVITIIDNGSSRDQNKSNFYVQKI